MRSLTSKFGMFAMTAVMASCVVAGCSGSVDDKTASGNPSGEKQGEVGLLLQPVAGITVNQVHYVVNQGATIISEGDLPTPGNEETFSFGIPLPVGTGYTLTLSGVAQESAAITCTGTSPAFSVTANSSSDVTMVLTCVNSANGSVIADVTVATDDCPRLAVHYAVATPSTAVLPDGTINVFAAATDLDGRPVTYSWSVADAAIGDFTPANIANTTFNCNGAGTGTLITVTADNGQCDKQLSTKVSCINLTCGNGVLDAGEDCDFGAPLNQACPSDCTVECGDGDAEAPVEECDPPVANICSATCQNIPIVCGDGVVVAPTEECEPPNTATCDAACQDIVVGPQSCGDGIVNAPGGVQEACDSGAVVYSEENCGADCQPISSAGCQTCAAAACTGAETCVGTPSPTQCNKVLDCVRDTGCADGGFALFCYCGAVSATECDTPGGAQGACKADIEIGLGSTDPGFIQANLFETPLSAGRAMARVDCELGSGCGSVCN